MKNEVKRRFNPNILDNHEIEWVVNTPELKHLIFAQKYKDDGKWNSNGFMRVTLYNGTLIIAHDYGDAVYHWGSNISFEFIAGCNLYYFREKCQASEYGRMFEEWDRETAREKVEWLVMNTAGEWYEDLTNDSPYYDENDEDIWTGLSAEKQAKYLGYFLEVKDIQHEYECLKGACGDEVEFYSYVRENSEEVDKLCGGEWWERIGNMKVPAIRCEIHLLAMKKIWELMEKENQKQMLKQVQHDKEGILA